MEVYQHFKVKNKLQVKKLTKFGFSNPKRRRKIKNHQKIKLNDKKTFNEYSFGFLVILNPTERKIGKDKLNWKI